MKKTLLTIALTVIVVLTVVGVVASQVRVGSVFRQVSQELPADYGYGGGGAVEPYAVAEEASAPMLDAFAPVESANLARADGGLVSQPALSDTERKVIKNADLAIVVKDPDAEQAKIRKLADDLKGYVVASNTSKITGGIDNVSFNEISITIRVPADKLDEALEKIKKGVVDVDYESTSSVDITSEFIDLQARLKAKEDAAKKLTEIMNKAEKTEDVLAVYVQLQAIQTEIESLKGQIKYYDESAAMSAISIRLIPERGSQPIEVKPWSPSGAWNEALEKLDAFAKGFADFVITLVGFALPALLLVVLPIAILFFGGRALFRRFAKSKVTEVKEEEKK